MEDGRRERSSLLLLLKQSHHVVGARRDEGRREWGQDALGRQEVVLEGHGLGVDLSIELGLHDDLLVGDGLSVHLGLVLHDMMMRGLGLSGLDRDGSCSRSVHVHHRDPVRLEKGDFSVSWRDPLLF